MTDTIKTWQERNGLLNSEPFRAFIGVEWDMQAEIDELRAALAQQAEQVPDTYQLRMKADWMNNWAEWVTCNKDQHEMYLRAPKLHDWNYETRALYAAAPKGGV